LTIRIVVDSTADIPRERAQMYDIEVVPLMVLFGDETYRDGVDLDTPTFYRKLVASHILPTTSTPPPAAFEDAYRKLASEGATGILSLSLASSLSATFSVAQGAAAIVSQETGVPIEVVDSHTVSAGIGVPAQIVAREAHEGRSLAELKAHAEGMFSRTRIIVVLDTLEYLQRGGRIGRGRALLGTMLNVKPLLAVRDGQVVPLENVRTRGKAQERIGQMVAEMGPLESLSIVESDAEAGASLETIVRRTWQGPIEHSILGPVIGVHVGPGVAAVVVILQDAGA
jgi:DegV family protein with EDD domain